MADYHVKNTGHLSKAFKVRGGHQVVAAGKSADVVDARELTEAQIDALAKDGVKVNAKGGKAKAAGNGQPSGAYAVKEQSPGWYAVVGTDGKAVTKNFRKDDLAEFDAMSAEDKAAFIELHKPE